MINKEQVCNQSLLKFIFLSVTVFKTCLLCSRKYKYTYAINIYNLNDNIGRQKKNWYVLWMDEGRLPKIMLNYKSRSYTYRKTKNKSVRRILLLAKQD
jgi:hypothetical protein